MKQRIVSFDAMDSASELASAIDKERREEEKIAKISHAHATTFDFHRYNPMVCHYYSAIVIYEQDVEGK